MVVAGAEMRTDIGDVIGLLINKETKATGFDDSVREIKEQGRVVVLRHPCRGHILIWRLKGSMSSKVSVLG